MKLTFEAFARPLFGPRYQGAVRALLVSGIVFFGLRLAGLRWSLPLPTLYLLVTAGTGGILWQSLAAEGRSPNLENPCMLARFLADLCVLLCRRPGQPYPSHQNGAPLGGPAGGFRLAACGPWGSLLCGVHGVLVTAALFAQRTWVVGGLWAAAVAALLLLGEPGRGSSWVWPPAPAGRLVPVAHGRVRLLPAEGSPPAPSPVLSGRPSLGRYLVRYLLSHKNYLVNTGILWAWPGCCPCSSGRLRGCGWPRWGLPCSPSTPPMGDPAVLRPQLSTGHPFSAGAKADLLPSLWSVPLRLPSGCRWVLSVQLAASNGRRLRPHAGYPLSSLPWKAPSWRCFAGMVLSHPELENGERPVASPTKVCGPWDPALPGCPGGGPAGDPAGACWWGLPWKRPFSCSSASEGNRRLTLPHQRSFRITKLVSCTPWRSTAWAWTKRYPPLGEKGPGCVGGMGDNRPMGWAFQPFAEGLWQSPAADGPGGHTAGLSTLWG